MPIIKVTDPTITNFRDGYFTGAASYTPPGKIVDYSPREYRFWGVPAVTMRMTEQPLNIPPVNKRIVYVNGIQTFSQAHAHTVKLISVITGAQVCGIYNMSGDGHDVLISKNTETILSIINPELGIAAKVANGLHTLSGFLTDLGQCISDKLLQVYLNPATMTLAGCIVDSCIKNVPLNIVAHSQGAIITSGAVRLAISALAIIYSERLSAREPHGFLHFLKSMTLLGQMEKIAKLRLIQKQVEEVLHQNVSIQTFGGAATWYPNGPWYRHVYNTAGAFSGDLVPKLAGQGNILAYPGAGGTVERLNRGGKGVTGNHSIDENYLQTSQNFSGGAATIYNVNYVPIHMNMIR